MPRTRRFSVALLALAAALALSCSGLQAQARTIGAPSSATRSAPHLVATDPRILASLQAIERDVPSLAPWFKAARSGPTRVYVGTLEPPDRPGATLTEWLGWSSYALSRGRVATLSRAQKANLSAIEIGVNIEYLDSVFALAGLPKEAVRWEVDAILLHEIAHTEQALLHRDPAAWCLDPVAGESPLSNCVIRRSNELRLELARARGIHLPRVLEYGQEVGLDYRLNSTASIGTQFQWIRSLVAARYLLRTRHEIPRPLPGEAERGLARSFPGDSATHSGRLMLELRRAVGPMP